MNIQEKIIKGYPLTKKIESELNCYCLDNKRYLIFWDELIKKEDIYQILNELQEKTNNSNFTEWKTLIIVGKTEEDFKKEELFYFNNVNTFAVFFLVNEKTNTVLMNDSWIFAIGLNYKKYVRKINEILKS